jgi:hypothetical protein
VEIEMHMHAFALYYYHNSGNAKSISNAKCFFTNTTLIEMLIPLRNNKYDTVEGNRKNLTKRRALWKVSENQREVQNTLLHWKWSTTGLVHAIKI